MRVFVAGATGVVGRRLVMLLRQGKHDVTGTTRSTAKAAALYTLGAAPAIGCPIDSRPASAALLYAWFGLAVPRALPAARRSVELAWEYGPIEDEPAPYSLVAGTESGWTGWEAMVEG